MTFKMSLHVLFENFRHFYVFLDAEFKLENQFSHSRSFYLEKMIKLFNVIGLGI